MHRPPYGAIGIILKKQVPGAVIIYHAIGIIGPFFLRGKMDLWTIHFMI
jgi:hypothetical protein